MLYPDADPAGSKALGSGLVPDLTSLDPVWIRIRPDPKILDPVHPTQNRSELFIK